MELYTVRNFVVLNVMGGSLSYMILKSDSFDNEELEIILPAEKFSNLFI